MTGRRIIFFIILLATIWVIPTSAAPTTTIPVVIKIAPGANLSLINSLLGGTLIGSIPEANTYLLRLPSLPVLNSTLKLLGVEWLELNRGTSLPANPRLALLDVPWNAGSDWYKNQPGLQLVRSQAALQYSTGRGLLIADINSRVDIGHPALQGHIAAGYDFVTNRPADVVGLNDDQSTAGFLDDDQSTAGFLDDDQSTAGFLDGNGIKLLAGTNLFGNGAADHGTFCAGILAVMAPDASIMPLRAFDDNGNADLFTLAKAIRYARRNGAQVLNMSFGTLTDSKVLREAIEYARAGNVLLIASAGNNNTSAPQYPAAYPGVLAVAATDELDEKSEFSNYGSYVFVDAPGTHIISAVPGGQYSIANGTSFSAPMVAAMGALIRSIRYNDTTATIANSAVNINSRNPKYYGQLGYGRIDVLRAVKTK
jgi:subtilisin family serine protease